MARIGGSMNSISQDSKEKYISGLLWRYTTQGWGEGGGLIYRNPCTCHASSTKTKRAKGEWGLNIHHFGHTTTRVPHPYAAQRDPWGLRATELVGRRGEGAI